MKDLISIPDLSQKEIIALLDLADKIEKKEVLPDMRGRLAALLFFEPSTRTCFSFDTAMKRMGGETLIMSGAGNTSVKKGESLGDTLKTVSMYADLIVIRSPLEGAARYASEAVNIPVINAGDGANQHPTQAMLDLYSIQKIRGTLEDLNIGLVGDLRYGRTVHSLVQALMPFHPNFLFVSPKHLSLPGQLLDELREKGIPFAQTENVEELVAQMDIMYVTRIQRERFPDQEEYEKLKGSYIIGPEVLTTAKKELKILHPLPRVDEITTDLDPTPAAYYFEQAKNGVFMRQAIISALLEEAEPWK